MPDVSYLPPPAAQQQSASWAAVLNQTPASTADLNQYRFGGYNTHPTNNILPVPVPHPQNKYYSSIETAKRKQENVWWQRKRMELHNRDIQKQKWIRPMSESAFQIHRPNIQNWNSVLNRRY